MRAAVHDCASLDAWIASHAKEIDAHPAAWCAVELAVLDLLGQTAGQPVEALISRPRLEGRFRYSAVLGDATPETFGATAERYLALGFKDFKVKLSGDFDRDRAKLDALRARPDIRVRGDANNLWDDAGEAIEGIEALDFPFFALEEPIAANQYAGLAEVSAALGTRIVLDESFLRIEQLAALTGPPRTLDRQRARLEDGRARCARWPSWTGRDRETWGSSWARKSERRACLTRAALTVAMAAGGALVAQEGAFGTFLLERDICEPPLMFGRGGVLDSSAHGRLAGAGWGL